MQRLSVFSIIKKDESQFLAQKMAICTVVFKIDGKLSPIFLQGVNNESLVQTQDQLRDGDSALPTLRVDKPPLDGEGMQKHRSRCIVTGLIALSEQKAAFRACSLLRVYPVEGKCLDRSWKSVGDCRTRHFLCTILSVLLCLIQHLSSLP